MATFFPLVLATLAAVANVPAVYFQVAHEYGFRGVELLTRITLPAIMPQVITALRVTGGMAWLVLVAAEMIAGRDGLGFAIWDARNGLRLDLLVCGMVVIGLTGVILDWLLSLLAKLPGVRWGYEH
jgi:NitT/TauT family transport system permease protein